MTSYTPRKNYPYPGLLETLDGAEADFHNFANVKDLENEGQGDAMTAGVQLEGDWAGFKNMAVVAATGVLEVSASGVNPAGTGGPVWLPDSLVPGALMRATSTPKAWSVTPSSLPASGKFMAIAVEVTAATWNEQVTAIAHSGTEKATQIEAEAAVPAVTSGYVRIATAIVKNTGGTPKYIMASQTDPEAVPSLSVTETFDHTNENPFAFGGKWNILGGAAAKGKIESNVWKAITQSVTEAAYYNVAENANPFVSAEIIFSSKPNGQGITLMTCIKPSSWAYMLVWEEANEANEVALYRVKMKGNISTETWEQVTLLASTPKESVMLASGDRIAISVREGKVRAYHRPAATGVWMMLLEVADTKNTEGGYSGFSMNSAGGSLRAQINDWTVGETPAGPKFNPMVSGPSGAHSSQQYVLPSGGTMRGIEEDITISPTRPAYVLLTFKGISVPIPTVKVVVNGIAVYTGVQTQEAETSKEQSVTIGFMVPANAVWRVSLVEGGEFETVKSKYSYILL